MKKSKVDIFLFCENNQAGYFWSKVSKLIKKNRLLFLIAALLISAGLTLILSSFRSAGNPFGVTRVVIDAGHGGHDSGCLGKNAKEKDVALGIALKLGRMIEESYPDVKVIYTRKKDEFVELHERAAIANNAKADLFICIHCNSACFLDKRKKEVCNSETNGVETWVMGLHKSEANLEVAKRENEVVLMEKDYTKKYEGFDPNSPEANIIFSLYQNSFIDQSLRMASYVQREVKAKGRQVRGVKQAGFLVLFKTTMPSVLIETGFLSNAEEENFLSSTAGQEKMAGSIYRAFKSYKNSIESPKSSIDFGLNKSDDTVNKVDRPDKEQIEEIKGLEDNGVNSQELNAAKNPDKGKDDTKSKGNGTDLEKSDELYWAIQFYTSPRRLKSTDPKFKGLKDIRIDFENKIYKYSTGRIEQYNDALQMQDKVRAKGFKDAFVVGIYRDNKIPLKEALKIAKKQK